MHNVFTRKTASKFLGLSISSLDRFRKSGKLSYYRFGKKVLFLEDNLTTFREAYVIPAKTEGGENAHNF